MTYQSLLSQVIGGIHLAETPPVPLPGELELQALWFAGAFGRDFTDHHGRAVRIIQFGEWNRTAGPDFLRAAIEICAIALDDDRQLHRSDGSVSPADAPGSFEVGLALSADGADAPGDSLAAGGVTPVRSCGRFGSPDDASVGAGDEDDSV